MRKSLHRVLLIKVFLAVALVATALPESCHAYIGPLLSTTSASRRPFEKYTNLNLLDRLNDINIVVVTDVHSWVAGHGRHEGPHHLNADYGDILSWYRHLQTTVKKAGKDVFFVMNGDFLDGTGLSQVPPEHLTPILQRMPFAAVNLGNHEIYYNGSIEYLKTSGFIDHWKGNYLSSNAVWANSGEPIGDRYTFWTCSQDHQHHHHRQQQQQPCSIIVFGFLFNFERNCENTRVERVQETIQQSWFIDVLQRQQGSFETIVVLAHMDYLDPLVGVLHRTIRAIVGPDMPIQFITGHSHRRGFKLLDPLASSFEAGRFLDTVGFISFPRVKRDFSFPNFATAVTNETLSRSATSVFQPVFFDTSTAILSQTLGGGGGDDSESHGMVKTLEGQELSRFINETIVSLALDHVVGCSRMTFFLHDTSLTDPNSLWGLWMNQIIPSTLLDFNTTKVFIQSTGALKDNLWIGKITTDDLIHVSPYNDPIYLVAQRISGADIDSVLQRLGASNPNFRHSELPTVAVSGFSDFRDYRKSAHRLLPDQFYDLYTPDWDMAMAAPVVANVTGQPELSPSILLVHSKHEDEEPQTWTTGRAWREFVSNVWPCDNADESTTRNFSTPSPRATQAKTDEGSTLWHVLAVLGLTPFLAWIVNLNRFRRLSTTLERTSTSNDSESLTHETTALLLASNESYNGSA